MRIAPERGALASQSEIWERARLARDPRFDGLFFVGVVTTGIYCRPICPARPPASENVRYFRSAAAAHAAGYRPCLRCRPERAATLAPFSLGSRAVIRALSHIDGGWLNDRSVTSLAARLGLGVRQLNRLFLTELGASPKSIACMQRAVLARRLIDETELTFAEIAGAAGYGSVRRFNHEMRVVFGRSPRELRSQRAGRSAERTLAKDRCTLRLPLREPYDRVWVMSFLARRAIPGLEFVEDGVYRRCLPDAGHAGGWLEARLEPGALLVSFPAAAASGTADILGRVRRVFDLDADPVQVDRHLASSPRLARAVTGGPGLRVPGAWDGFELAVRAILGQQVSVARATRLAMLLVERFGETSRHGTRTFPSPECLARENPARIGIPGTRGAAVQELARRVAGAHLVLDASQDPEALRRALIEVPGVGRWTAEYVALRAGRDPDAFPDTDWVVLKVLGAKPAAARAIAEPWRPWRGYALMYLWRAARDGGLPAAVALPGTAELAPAELPVSTELQAPAELQAGVAAG